VNNPKFKLSDFPSAIIAGAGHLSGGDKPHPYLVGETLFAVAGFIPACVVAGFIPACKSAEFILD
jgi:hypothetical protein